MVKSLASFLFLSTFCLSITAETTTSNEASPSSSSTFNESTLKPCDLMAMDKIITWLFFFNDPHRVLPRNAKEIEEFCDEKSRKELYVNAYARKCLAKFPRQVTSLLMFGVARKNRYYCNSPKGRVDILQGARCLNAIKTTGAQCMAQTIADMKAIRYAPTEGKIAKTCCTYYRLEECLVSKVQEEKTSCNSKDPKRMEELLEGYTGQMINHVCSQYPKDIDHCAKVLPKRELSKLRKLATAKKPTGEFKSILQPMIDILDSIPP